MQLCVDGSECLFDIVFMVCSGQVLSFDYLKVGVCSYFVIVGGIDVLVVLESCFIYVLGVLGGWQGCKLVKEDELLFGWVLLKVVEGCVLLLLLVLVFDCEVMLCVVLGLYKYCFIEEVVECFFVDIWIVGLEVDCIGYCFKGGQVMQFKLCEQFFGVGLDFFNIVDVCYFIGLIQIFGGLEFIVLLWDVVFGGGYVIIGMVISVDFDLIG